MPLRSVIIRLGLWTPGAHNVHLWGEYYGPWVFFGWDHNLTWRRTSVFFCPAFSLTVAAVSDRSVFSHLLYTATAIAQVPGALWKPTEDQSCSTFPQTVTEEVARPFCSTTRLFFFWYWFHLFIWKFLCYLSREPVLRGLQIYILNI